jgi:hypothetical protein
MTILIIQPWTMGYMRCVCASSCSIYLCQYACQYISRRCQIYYTTAFETCRDRRGRRRRERRGANEEKSEIAMEEIVVVKRRSYYYGVADFVVIVVVVVDNHRAVCKAAWSTQLDSM